MAASARLVSLGTRRNHPIQCFRVFYRRKTEKAVRKSKTQEATEVAGVVQSSNTEKFRNTAMSLDQTVCEDLKAFERRLTEVISSLQPSTLRWRMLLGVISVCTAVGAWHWLTDPNTSAVSFTQSLYNHPFFTVASIVLVILFVMGVHRRVIAPSIITQRARSILGDFNMSCDDTGKLILKPTRPPHSHES